MKGRQTYKREEERQRQEKYTELGENEWAESVISAHHQSLMTSEKFSLLMASIYIPAPEKRQICPMTTQAATVTHTGQTPTVLPGYRTLEVWEA